MSKRLAHEPYAPELFRLQAELVKLQEWVRGEQVTERISARVAFVDEVAEVVLPRQVTP